MSANFTTLGSMLEIQLKEIEALNRAFVILGRSDERIAQAIVNKGAIMAAENARVTLEILRYLAETDGKAAKAAAILTEAGPGALADDREELQRRARAFRDYHGLPSTGGSVLFHLGQAFRYSANGTKCSDVVPGVISLSDDGFVHVATGGDHDDGAEEWVLIFNPEARKS